MIPQNLSMSRESRKILNELEILAQSNNTSTLVTPTQVYLTDQLIMKYYTAPILNAIKSKIKQLHKKSSKHFTVEHWVSVLDTIFQNNSSVKRESPITVVDTDQAGIQGFIYISRFLITDYSIEDAKMIFDVIHRYTPEMIKDAISKSASNKIYNIQYVNAILEKEQALSNIKKQEINKLRERADNSNSILNRQKVEHTPMDMAVSQYNWEQQRQNAELERKMQEMFGK